MPYKCNEGRRHKTDMRQNPVGEPAATAALNFDTPRRRSSLKRLGPFRNCCQRYERSEQLVAEVPTIHFIGMARPQLTSTLLRTGND
jgi:hypothetical protein